MGIPNGPTSWGPPTGLEAAGTAGSAGSAGCELMVTHAHIAAGRVGVRPGARRRRSFNMCISRSVTKC
jgi:hypothetical protein